MHANSRELVKNLLTGQPVDRVPLRETFWSETLAAWVQQGYSTRTVYKDTSQKAGAYFMEGMKLRSARFVFSSDHSISPLVQYDSYRYALDTYHQHMWY